VPRRAFSASAFVRYQGKLLLVFHKALKLWLPVGGELFPGETPSEGALRELKEETGLVGRFPSGNPQRVEGTPDGYLGYEEHEASEKGIHLNFDFLIDVDTDSVVSDGSWSRHGWFKDPPEGAPPNVIQFFAIIRAWEHSSP